MGVGYDISIKELAELVAHTVGYEGDVLWESTKPDGTPRKLLDVSRISRMGWTAVVDLPQV